MSEKIVNNNGIQISTEEETRRADNLASMNNHSLITGGESYLEKTKEIKAPALIIHGTEDPIIPYEHGVSLSKVIPDAVLLTLEGTGHELTYGDWDTIIKAIQNHTTVISYRIS